MDSIENRENEIKKEMDEKLKIEQEKMKNVKSKMTKIKREYNSKLKRLQEEKLIETAKQFNELFPDKTPEEVREKIARLSKRKKFNDLHKIVIDCYVKYIHEIDDYTTPEIIENWFKKVGR